MGECKAHKFTCRGAGHPSNMQTDTLLFDLLIVYHVLTRLTTTPPNNIIAIVFVVPKYNKYNVMQSFVCCDRVLLSIVASL